MSYRIESNEVLFLLKVGCNSRTVTGYARRVLGLHPSLRKPAPRLRFIGSYISLLLYFFVTACTLGPTYQKPDVTAQLPARYHPIRDDNQKGSTTSKQWWLVFNDPAINQLVETALSRNFDIASADARIKQARAQLNIVDSESLPQLNSQSRIGRDHISRNSELLANLPLPNPNVSFTDYRAAFDASWEIDLFGHQARQSEAAQARLSSIENQREEVALRVAAEVARNVIDYRAWLLRSKNAQAMLDSSQQLVDLRVLQYTAGLISESEVSAAKTAMHQTAATIPSLQSAASAALMSLTVLADQSQEQLTTLLQTTVDIPTPPNEGVARGPEELRFRPKSEPVNENDRSTAGSKIGPYGPFATSSNHVDFLGLPSDLLLRRPDLRRAERELAAATADIGVAIAEQYPQLNLLGSGGLDSITPGKFTHLASSFWNIGPQLSIPLFVGGRLAAQVKNREAARDAALTQYRQAVLTAFADTETALIRYQREQQRLAQIDLAFTTQYDQVKLAELRYHAGETDFSSVLQSHQQLAQIHDQQLASQQALAGNLTALFKSLGGGIEE